MILFGDNVTLIPLDSEDLDIFYAINTHPFVRKYLWDDKEFSEEMATDILDEVEELFREKDYGLWKVMDNSDGSLAGYTGLWTFFDEPQPQLLFALLPNATGKGLATEAAKEIMQYAFYVLQFSYLTAATDKANAKSAEVCERLGMKLVEEKLMEGKPTLFYRIER